MEVIGITEQHMIVLYDSNDSWEQVCTYMDSALKDGWEVVSVWNATAGNMAFTVRMPNDVRVLYRRLR